MENLGAVPGRSLICYPRRRTVTRASQPLRSTAPGKTKGAEFKIWALGKQRLQIEFSGVYEYKTPQGPTANEGEGSGVATIEGDTAIFKPEGAEEECQITLRFTGGKLVVTQTGICGFGHNVSASRHLQKSFCQETEVRLGLTSVRGFVRPKLDSHTPVARNKTRNRPSF